MVRGCAWLALFGLGALPRHSVHYRFSLLRPAGRSLPFRGHPPRPTVASRRCAKSPRGPLPVAPFLAGPQLPAIPPGLRPESGSGLRPHIICRLRAGSATADCARYAVTAGGGGVTAPASQLSRYARSLPPFQSPATHRPALAVVVSLKSTTTANEGGRSVALRATVTISDTHNRPPTPGRAPPTNNTLSAGWGTSPHSPAWPLAASRGVPLLGLPAPLHRARWSRSLWGSAPIPRGHKKSRPTAALFYSSLIGMSFSSGA